MVEQDAFWKRLHARVRLMIEREEQVSAHLKKLRGSAEAEDAQESEEVGTLNLKILEGVINRMHSENGGRNRRYMIVGKGLRCIGMVHICLCIHISVTSPVSSVLCCVLQDISWEDLGNEDPTSPLQTPRGVYSLSTSAKAY